MESNVLEHHKQYELCKTRLPYRQGKKLTAIKTYTIADESKYLLIFGVPKINLRNELKNYCQKFGVVTNISINEDYLVEDFTQCFKVKYERIQSARIAKKIMDTKNFYGGVLHVCYAPECETVDELREKLIQRRLDVSKRMMRNNLDKQVAAGHHGGDGSTRSSDFRHLNQSSSASNPPLPHASVWSLSSESYPLPSVPTSSKLNAVKRPIDTLQNTINSSDLYPSYVDTANLNKGRIVVCDNNTNKKLILSVGNKYKNQASKILKEYS